MQLCTKGLLQLANDTIRWFQDHKQSHCPAQISCLAGSEQAWYIASIKSSLLRIRACFDQLCFLRQMRSTFSLCSRVGLDIVQYYCIVKLMQECIGDLEIVSRHNSAY